jgi:tetratricopeptide (TPR) repeat protein
MTAMTLVGQPPPSAALRKGLELLSQGHSEEAEDVVKKAAREAKKQHGSGSPPLALAYGELGRIHLRMGEFERAAKEFQHAADGPMPADPQHRRDRLTFLFGYGAALGELGRLAEAEKVLRQCLTFARNLYGAQSAMAAVALVPLADILLKTGKTAEAARLADSSYDFLWRLGDPLFTTSVGTRAEALKASGKADNAFADLTDLPEEIVADAVANTLARAGKGDTGRVRAVLADVLGFVDQKYGDGHSMTCDALAAMVHHEVAAGDKEDEKVRKTAVRRSVWSFAVRRLPGDLLDNLEVGFEPTGAIHLAPHLKRDPDPAEATQLQTILNQAVDDLYARPAART